MTALAAPNSQAGEAAQHSEKEVLKKTEEQAVVQLDSPR